MWPLCGRPIQIYAGWLGLACWLQAFGLIENMLPPESLWAHSCMHCIRAPTTMWCSARRRRRRRRRRRHRGTAGRFSRHQLPHAQALANRARQQRVGGCTVRACVLLPQTNKRVHKHTRWHTFTEKPLDTAAHVRANLPFVCMCVYVTDCYSRARAHVSHE